MALRAIELEPDLADAKMHLAAVSFHYDWAFERARSFLDEAMAINPGLEMALLLSANIHLVFQNHEKAQASIDRALEIDPLNIGLLMNAGDHLILQRRYREAIRVLESALKINSAFRPGERRINCKACQLSQVRSCPGPWPGPGPWPANRTLPSSS